MPWRELARFRDPSVPKLDNLRRAAARGIRVPETRWTWAAEVDAAARRPPRGVDVPCIVRSGSPTEDTKETSNAGQLLSLAVRAPARFATAVDDVVAALPRDRKGRPLGAIFTQPLVKARSAGVAFFDGFYFERTSAKGSNEGLTSGQARGDVVRGQVGRGDRWSDFLREVHAVFGGDIDLEFAEDDDGYVLLQVRPALFPIARNPTLSLANHKEILGDPPSPWIAAVVVAAGASVLDFFAAVDPEVGAWNEVYAVMLGERAWMNFSFFFRLMDHWGLPRAFVTQGVGGEGGGPLDARPIPARFAASALKLVRLQLASLRVVRRAEADLAALDRTIAAAGDLAAIHAANVAAMGLAIRTNFGINAVLSGVSRVRAAAGLEGRARVVTEEMMERYADLGRIDAAVERERALDGWLAAFGHRGPLESDPSRPRFAELREVLLDDLAASPRVASPDVEAPRPRAVDPEAEGGLLYAIDRRREWFRDELMKRWAEIRRRALAAGEALVRHGTLDAPGDVFWLAGEETRAPTRAAVLSAKARVWAVADLQLPATAPRGEILAALVVAESASLVASGARLFRGIPLGEAVVEGVAIKARDLVTLLASGALHDATEPILVVEALEPSWAVVFGRVRGVVAEIGGELSHASILLREARRPAIVNATGVFAAVRSGDRLRLDGGRGLVEILESA